MCLASGGRVCSRRGTREMKPLELVRRCAVLALIFTTRLALGAAGDLDPSFGTGGKVTTALGAGAESARKVRILSDGKILIAGKASNGTDEDFALVRYLADGSLDLSFNGSGFVTTGFQGDDEAGGVAIQNDGAIVVVGRANGADFDTSFAVARYLPTGALDPSFNGTGKLTFGFTPGPDAATGVAVTGDGKLLIGGSSVVNGVLRFTLVRLNRDGSFDTTFNGTGRVTTQFSSEGALASCMAVQGDGKILLGGIAGDEGIAMAVARYLPTGKLDKTFARTGMVTLAGTPSVGFLGIDESLCQTLVVQPDGGIILGGRIVVDGNSDVALVRLLGNGALDEAFGFGGLVRLDLGSADDLLFDIEPQADGKLLLAGRTGATNATDMALLRCTAKGVLDDLFGTAGRVITSFASASDGLAAAAVQPDGRIVGAGFANSITTDIALVRYLGDPQVTALTLPAQGVGANTGVLHGTVNPNGEPDTMAVFEWGTSPSALSNTTPPFAVGSGTDPVPVQATISGLTKGTVYYFRVRGDHPPFAAQRGEVLNFATISNNAPGVISQPASNLLADGAALNASVNPNRLATSVRFEWGTTTAYGNTTADIDVGSGDLPVPVNAVLTGLTTNQVYHFRAVATSEAGTTNGPDRTFAPSTGAPQPQDDVVLIDGLTTIRVLDNDLDPNGDALTIVGMDTDALPQSGSVHVVGDLVFYTPTDGMLEDEFGYVLQDSTGKTAKARVRAFRLSEVRGQYFGIISENVGNGQMNMQITQSGAFSLLLTWLGMDYELKGRFDSDRSFVAALPRKGVEQNALLVLKLQFDPLTGEVQAELTDSVLGGPFAFSALRSGEGDEAVDAVVGQLYTTTIDVPTMALPEGAEAGASGFAGKFAGSGFATVKIARNRSARFVGQMPDTAKFSAGSPVSRRTYALYSALYRARTGALGSVSGRASLQSNFELRSSSLTWQRAADSRDAIFNGAFNTPAFLTGDRYTPPTRGQLMQIGLELLSGSFSNAKASMTLGGLAPELQQALKFTPGSVRVVGENPSAMKLRISPRTGTFSGAFTHNVSQELTKFSGVFITSPFAIKEGRGSFRGVDAGGKVRIAKP